MADITKEQVVEFITNMTVLELSAFIKELEEKFGISAAAPMAAHQPIACIYICLLRKCVQGSPRKQFQL